MSQVIKIRELWQAKNIHYKIGLRLYVIPSAIADPRDSEIMIAYFTLNKEIDCQPTLILLILFLKILHNIFLQQCK